MELVVDTELEELEQWFEDHLRCAVDHDWLRNWWSERAPSCGVDAAAILSNHHYPFPVCRPLAEFIESIPENERCHEHPTPTCFHLNWL